MAKFIGNDTQTFDIEKIVIIWWNDYIDKYAEDVATIIFIDGTEVYLHYDCDEDFELINNLRKALGFKPLSRVR